MSQQAHAALIAARQHREYALQQQHAEQAVHVRQHIAARWQISSDRRIAKQSQQAELDKVHAEHQCTLLARRKRLAALLSKEQAEHRRMLDQLTETDSQRRERLLHAAQRLRSQRESDKVADVAARRQQQQRSQLDELRFAESRLRALQVADERATLEQSAAVRQARQAHMDEELYACEQASEAARQAGQRAAHDAEQIHIRQMQWRADLAQQCAGRAIRAKQAAAESSREAEESRAQAEQEKQLADAEAANARAKRRALALEMQACHVELMRARAQEYDRLREEERTVLDRLLAEEAEESEAAAEAKAERRLSMQRHLREHAEEQQQLLQRQKQTRQRIQQQLRQGETSSLSSQCNNNASADDEDDEVLWHAANEEAWAKKEARWNAEAAARDALLRSVLIARREQVMSRRAARARARSVERREHAEWVGALEATRGTLDDEARAKRMEMLAETQRCLEIQIAERQAQRAREKEHNRSVNDYDCNDAERERELAEAMAELEAAKPERYRNVPLLPHGRSRLH